MLIRKITCCILLLFLSGCSYSSDFVIANRSEQTIEVIYQFRTGFNTVNSCFDDYRPIPSVKPVAEMQKRDIEWRKLNKHEYNCDVKNLKVKLLLEPGMAVNVENMGNFRAEDVDIKFLSLENVNGTTTYKGDQVFKSFRRINETFHLLEYK